MDKHRDDIAKYINGELTPAEMHALEKRALDDPFLADALEGAAHISSANYIHDLQELDAKLTKRKSAAWTWPLRIAASVLLLMIALFVVWISLPQNPEQNLALESTPALKDSLPQTTPPSTVSSAAETNESMRAAGPHQSGKESSTVQPARAKKSPALRVQARQSNRLESASSQQDQSRDSVRKPTFKNNLNSNGFITAESVDKANLTMPSATDIKIAEGYIESIDARPTLVTGRVMSAEDGTPLPDVSVALKGTNITTKTDAYGRYSITANSKQKTLVYSSDGLESTEVKINGIDSTYLPVKIEMTEEVQKEAAVETSDILDFGPMNVYTIPAHPETGNRAFKQYLEKNHKYPKEARDQKVEGIVIIEFKVDATGALSEFRIVRGIGNGCDEEVIRLILQGAKWVPTTKDGTPVNDKARVKFKFELEP